MEVVDLISPITKYAVLLKDKNEIRYELEKMFYISQEGRPGPVLMDLPDDLQRAEINPDELRPFTIPSEKNDISNGFDKKFLDLLNNSKRPLVVPGYGIKLSKTQKKLFEFLKKQIFQLHQVGEPLIYFLAKMKMCWDIWCC